MILGLDLGRAVGVATIDDSGNPLKFDTWRFRQEDHAVMFYAFHVKLRMTIKVLSPELVAFEDLSNAFMQSKAWRSIFFGLRTSILISCEMLDQAYLGIHVAQWKKEFGVPGRKAHRETVLAAEAYCRQMASKPQIFPNNDNEAAALLVAVTAQRRWRDEV